MSKRPRRGAVPPRRPVRRQARWRFPAAIIVAAIVLVGVISAVLISQNGGATPLPAATGQPVDGISCDTAEQVVYHIHAHLGIFVNGQPQTVPAGIGIPNAQVVQTQQGPLAVSGSCFYWLHTHTADGIVHVESPVRRTYSLGDVFDIWAQPLSSTQVVSAKGPVFAYLDGQRVNGDPRNIPITPHGLIQLNVGQDLAPQPYVFPAGL